MPNHRPEPPPRRQAAPRLAPARAAGAESPAPRAFHGGGPASPRLTARPRIRDSVGVMKQSESVARESLEILNGLPHAAALLDAEGRLVAMNGRLEALTGHASAD